MESTIINLSIGPTFEILKKYFSDLCVEDAKERVKAVKGNVVKCGKDVTYEISSVEKYSIVWENVETGEKFTITLKSVTETDDTFLSWSASNDFVKSAVASISSKIRAKYWTMKRVRETFVSFFEKKKEHVFYRSSPTVPRDDPTLLFANAGMNQFKPIFMGQVPEGSPMDGMKRACNSQKCIRAGGKHNDLEDVGFDVYHHTFFEMLGNWSFGDYFKKEAIAWAWELLTEVYKLPADRLYATYFGGDKKMGLPADFEARDIWRKYMPDERIIPFDKKDNFWEMGATGPCGPCTEIHFDRIGGPASERAKIVNADDPNLLEIWNLVFMQFNRLPDGSLQKLSANSVDTGMGFERLTSVLQNKTSNYDTDVFDPIFRKIQSMRGKNVSTYRGLVGVPDVGRIDMAYRVIADHIRTLVFAISDGAVPGSTGRNYVLRRVLRRAVRFGQQQLGIEPGFMAKLVNTVVCHMKSAFPEIEAREKYVVEVIRKEEETFNRTVKKGIRKFNQVTSKMKVGDTMSGEDAYKLWSTYGFPKELTELMIEEVKMKMCTVESWNKAYKEQQEISRSGQKAADLTGMKLEANETLKLEKQGVQPTDSTAKYKWHVEHDAKIMALYLGMGKFADSVKSSNDQVIGIVLDRSSFYYTSGGQCTDTGSLSLRKEQVDAKTKDGEEEDITSCFNVSGCEQFGKYVLHIGTAKANLKVGDLVTCHVDYDRRSLIAPNHTMTHVLNFALRKVLDPKTDQKGSLVDQDKLRFDFNGDAMTADQILKVEEIVNKNIDDSLPVETKVVPFVKATQIQGLRRCAEDYPEFVRVVSVGTCADSILKDPSNSKWSDYSVELCGGTHISNSSRATKFAILEEGSIQAGIRRVVAVTGERAVDAYVQLNFLESRFEEVSTYPASKMDEGLKQLQSDLNAAVAPISGKRRLRAEYETMQKRHFEAKKKILSVAVDQLKADIEAKKDQEIVVLRQTNVLENKKKLSGIVKKATKKNKDSSYILLGKEEAEGNVFALAFVSKAHQKKGLNAIEWVNDVCKHCGGAIKTGGREANAQGSGKDISKFDEACAAAEKYGKAKIVA